MKKLLVACILVGTLAAAAHASSVCSGYLASPDQLCDKINQLKDVIRSSCYRSGVTLWAPFYYWTCKDDSKRIFYCYTLVPLGQFDADLQEKVQCAVSDCKVEPVYVPVRIIRAGGMRS
ncbi:MAG TPA: hypothetical protein VK463_17035 [Desulfomonilaceae bacterium]|nr:hypothetical protein [Desulfomonilaceae bacterium]